ncbi:CrcB family protein [Agreia sp. VKM Ac-1783]|uniref:fluoride efflux transporter FluC n=1 Tax=Agreia sp. VKM Ac-1783 TaxID=1938889 RepID=UPI000A2AC039|nr:CrcB family protein [Agreia sp. VKM Ac-1783]SMQ68329.1 CrcB protein [Agreia sp. VKM Ac-1783]
MQNRPLAHLVAVFLGGVVGSALRLSLDLAIPHADQQFPVDTLLINTVGSFVLGWLTAGLFRRGVSTIVKAAVGPGLLGSFTTFSAVILALVLLTVSGPNQLILAVVYLGVTLVLGLGAAFLGLRLGERHDRRRRAEEPTR